PRDLLARVRRLARRDQWGDETQTGPLFDVSVRVLISSDLLSVIDPKLSGDSTLFDQMLPDMREDIARRIGVLVPGVRVSADGNLPRRTMQFVLHGVPKALLRLGD